MTDPLADALAELHANPPTIRKTRNAQYGKYAGLPDVVKILRPHLERLGLRWQEWTGHAADGQFLLRYEMSHKDGGRVLCGDWPIHATDPQKQGSAVTYARRYALVTVTGLTPEGDDDDGARASQPSRKPVRADPAHERLIETEGGQSAGHGRVEGVTRSRGPVGDDVWAAEPPEEQPGSGKPLLGKLQAAYKNAGITDSDVRHGIAEQVTRRRIENSNQLSLREVEAVIKHLKAGI